MAKREIREQRRQAALRRKRNRQIITISVVAVFAVAAIIFIVPELASSMVREHPNPNANTLGDPDAPVLMEVFSDFNCSHCQAFFFEKEAKLIEEYVATGDVYYEYHPYFFASSSQLASEASYCAADENKFWDFHDALYTNPGDLQQDYLVQVANAIGLDTDAFEQCLDSGKYTGVVNGDVALGDSYGIQGTPTFFINGTMIEGNQDYDVFTSTIDAALAAAGQ